MRGRALENAQCMASQENKAVRSGPLSGIRVLDLTRVFAGPFCTKILGDLGAEILKVEALGTGDRTRALPPIVEGESHYFHAINHNKKSIAIDTRTPEGHDVALDLARHADIIIENFRPDVMDRLGLSTEILRAANPKLIVCSISGYGKGNTMSNKPSFDVVAQAMSGVMSLTGEPDGPPTKIGVPLGDIAGGVWAAISVLSALQHRNATGEALEIDLSLFDGLIGILGCLGEIYLMTGKSPARYGGGHYSVVPYGLYPCKDGHIVIAPHVGDFWEKLCMAIGRPDLAEDSRFRTVADRSAHRDILQPLVGEILKTRTATEWHEILDAADVPNSMVNSVGEALNEPVVGERKMIRSYEHPTGGTIRVIDSPVRFVGRFEDEPMAHAPLLGEHTRSILADLLGYSKERISTLAEHKVIG